MPEQLKRSNTALLVLAIIGLAILLLVPLVWLTVVMIAGPATMSPRAEMPGRMGELGATGEMLMGGWAIFGSIALFVLAAFLLVVLVRALQQR